MYAHIAFSQSITHVIRYHELKVEKGRAELIFAGNALKDQDHLGWSDKLYHFQRLSVRNDSIVKSTLHISLNFHHSEELSNAKMQTIALVYIQKMRLAHQPFLVYRHFDTPHPHLHIVCSGIQKNGSKIPFSKANYYESIKLTTELGKDYALKPSGIKLPDEEWFRLYPLQKIVYGTTVLYPTFNRIIKAVVENYKFTSLPEFNALLGLYNIKACRRKESSFLYQHKGLYYKPVLENGKTAATYFPASDLTCRPTLANLEKKFLAHRYDTFRQFHQKRVTDAIDNILSNSSLTLTSFTTALSNNRISAVMPKDKTGAILNIFYIDQQAKSVFDAASLGPRYTAAAILERCRLPGMTPVQPLIQEQKLTQQQQQIAHRRRPGF